MFRKAIHLVVGLLLFLLSRWLERDIILVLILLGSVFSFLTFPYQGFSQLHRTGDGSLGTLFYPVGILSSFLILYHQPMVYFQASLLVLAVSDPMANLLGQLRRGNGRFRLLHDPKSFFGMAAFAISSCLIFLIVLPSPGSFDVFFLLSLVLLSVVLELLSWRGSDNLTIPLGLALYFSWSLVQEPDYLLLVSVVLFFGGAAWLLFLLRFLSHFGSLAAWVLGVFLLGVMGWQWLVPVMVFFLTSVAFTRLKATVFEKKRSGGRNAWQVAANSLWAVCSAVLYLLWPQTFFIYLFITYVAAVTADTWASELGPLINRRSFSLSDFRMHRAGVTGGVSPGGTLAALAGAGLIAFTSWPLFFSQWDWQILLLITTSAFLACFADTLLGAFVEGRLLSLKFFRVEHPEKITPNDLVNLGGSLTAGLFLWLLLSL